MRRASHDFQIFVKPTGSICNLGCDYCYYLNKELLYPERSSYRMPDDMLETYIAQHIRSAPQSSIRFSWHGGEPTLLGVDYFRRIVALQRKHCPPDRHITNGIQTNGTLLDADWCRFLASEGFNVGLSLDGPQQLHDRFRVTKRRQPTHRQTMRGYELLRQHNVYVDILCVVNAYNVCYPAEVYQFFKQIGAPYIGFLPLVEPWPDSPNAVSDRSVPAEAFGSFLCTVFDEWKRRDIGQVKVQIFEEVSRTAFGQEQRLCIFRKICGDIPVIEHNGDFYACDHFVDNGHLWGNIAATPLVEMLEGKQQRAFGQAKQDTLPRYCRSCDVLNLCNGECPKNRFIQTPDGEPGLNYLCAGYKPFFNHCRPFLEELANLWRRQSIEPQTPAAETAKVRSGPKTGRNDPCPCGSGRKYKKCCLGKF
ncbi:MAG: anaerobic sulfatase maturase [Desulfobacteraceae bacterium]|nr:anaerobic sulfatase maturase [Desulfobacteraceae bacterium]